MERQVFNERCIYYGALRRCRVRVTRFYRYGRTRRYRTHYIIEVHAICALITLRIPIVAASH